MAYTLQIPDAAYQALAATAAARGMEAEELLLKLLADFQEDGALPADPWAGFRSAGEATTPDLTDRHDHYLAEAHANEHTEPA